MSWWHTFTRSLAASTSTSSSGSTSTTSTLVYTETETTCFCCLWKRQKSATQPLPEDLLPLMRQHNEDHDDALQGAKPHIIISPKSQ